MIRYGDRIEITSPGALQNGMTIEKMIAGQRVPRNLLISETLRDYRYSDARGIGVRNKVIPSMRAHNGVDPEFEATEDYVRLTLRRRAPNAVLPAGLEAHACPKGKCWTTRWFIRGAESGRTVFARAGSPRRPTGATTIRGRSPMAGGGSDRRLAFNILKDPVHIHNLHATMLHVLDIGRTFPYDRRAARPPSVRIALHYLWSRLLIAELIDQVELGRCSFASGT